MTAGTLAPVRYAYGTAAAVAIELLQRLQPACLPGRLCVAGGLRRRSASVHDIEILYVGRVCAIPPADLFAPAALSDNLAERLIAGMLDDGTLAKRLNVRGRPSWGAKNKLALHIASGIPVDLFAATEANWFNYLVCRTGPAELNMAIASAAKARGCMWHPYGEGFDTPAGPVRCCSEADVFAQVGFRCLPPWERR